MTIAVSPHRPIAPLPAYMAYTPDKLSVSGPAAQGSTEFSDIQLEQFHRVDAGQNHSERPELRAPTGPALGATGPQRPDSAMEMMREVIQYILADFRLGSRRIKQSVHLQISSAKSISASRHEEGKKALSGAVAGLITGSLMASLGTARTLKGHTACEKSAQKNIAARRPEHGELENSVPQDAAHLARTADLQHEVDSSKGRRMAEQGQAVTVVNRGLEETIRGATHQTMLTEQATQGLVGTNENIASQTAQSAQSNRNSIDETGQRLEAKLNEIIRARIESFVPMAA